MTERNAQTATRSPCPSAGSRWPRPTDLEVGADQGRVLLRHATWSLWRDEDGEAHVQDAFCPHLGAHLGHGGTVDGCEIVCPFHGWKFDAEGTNTDIPYCERTNSKAKLRTYPVAERNGFIYAWYHPHDEPPTWEIDAVAEIHDRRVQRAHEANHVVAGRHPGDGRERRRLRPLPLRAQRGRGPGDRAATRPTATGRSWSRSSSSPRPAASSTAASTSIADGPGLRASCASAASSTRSSSAASTPIDADQTETRFNFYVRNFGDAATNSTVGEAFATEVDKQFDEDMPIWENKAHLVRPALADTDGPFMKFRKWYSQFYAETRSATTAPCSRRRTGPRRWTRPRPRPPPPPSTATPDPDRQARSTPLVSGGRGPGPDRAR